MSSSAAAAANPKTTLLTGSNGALGFPILLHLLRANHTVHAALRTPEKASRILASKSITSLPDSLRNNLHTVIIPDLLSPTAYDAVLSSNKIEYVVHVASRIPGSSAGKEMNYEQDMINPAIQGTLNILEATERAVVKRVVITSSVVAMMSLSEFGSENNNTVYDECSRTEDPAGPFTDESTAYRASKIMALNAAERWLDNGGKGRRVEVVHVHPAFVLGSVELAGSKKDLMGGSSGVALAMTLASDPLPRPFTSVVCWLEDVAEVHVRALSARIPNGQGLLVVGDGVEGMIWEDGKEILERVFPEAVAKGKIGNNGWTKTIQVKFDAKRTEELVGMKFEGFERGLVDAVGRYLQILGELKE